MPTAEHHVAMTHYLDEVGRFGRAFAIVGLSLTTAILAALNLLFVVLLSDKRARAEIPGPLIGCGLIFGFLTFVSVWMLLRLLRGTRSANKITMMPVRFIQVFGMLLGAGLLHAALKGGQPLFVIEGLGIALGMVFVPRLLKGQPSEGTSA